MTFALPKLSFDSKICEISLSTRLANIQNELSSLFTLSLLSYRPVERSKIDAVFFRFQQDNTSKCAIKFDKKTSSILLISGGENVRFSIIPKDFSSNPKIFCPLINPLCKRLNYKTKMK
ncbi:hypothetical protein [Helicobacter sp. 13S00482-2]|uniref:hypothetical protein n=1 Tax=Helicobacter sp. 13S00482-2 TaxID=1476200 RepID=UPI001C5D7C46|nr:hypothetical protein [Helicobacter sp. 13S00482-2]